MPFVSSLTRYYLSPDNDQIKNVSNILDYFLDSRLSTFSDKSRQANIFAAKGNFKQVEILNTKLKGIEIKQHKYVNYLCFFSDETMLVSSMNAKVTDKFNRKNWFLNNWLSFFSCYMMP